MRSSISSSKILVVSVFVLAAAIPLGIHEWFVRTYYLTGGFVMLVPVHNMTAAVFDEADVMVLGSSRAKESVQPKVIETARPEWGRPINRAAHSGTSVDQLNELHQRLELKQRVPPRLIVTVEPLHFSSAYVVFDRRRVTGVVTPDQSFFRRLASEAQRWSQDTQARIGDAVGRPIYAVLQSASPPQKREIGLWMQSVHDIARSGPRDPLHLPRIVRDSYLLRVIGKSARFYSNVVFEDRGFEGHVLHLAEPTATREEAFASHMGQYPGGVLAFYKRAYLAKFREDLAALSAAGVKIVLVRLPTYHTMHEMEEQAIPDFNASMQSIAGELKLRYIDFNSGFEWLTEDEHAFTDASHMEFDKTAAFTKAMVEAIGEF